MYRKTVISLHGILTRGEWQKHLAPYVSGQGWIYHPLDYGHFTARHLVLSIKKKKQKIQWLRDELNRINKESDGSAPTIIVHSFGSYLLGQVLEKYDDIKFDQIVLTGSIINREFNWRRHIEAGRVSSVYNIGGGKDLPANFAQLFVKGAGNSGTKGFSNNVEIKEKIYPNFEHSDAHAHDVFKHQIIPFIDTPPNIPPSNRLENNLPPVRPIEAASWSAATYFKQFLERFRNAVASGQFKYMGDSSPVVPTPKILRILIPESSAQAEALSRDQISGHIPGQPILFGTDKDQRSAHLGYDGIVYDLPSITASFSMLENFYSQQDSSQRAINEFKRIIERVIEGTEGSLDYTIEVQIFKPKNRPI